MQTPRPLTMLQAQGFIVNTITMRPWFVIFETNKLGTHRPIATRLNIMSKESC